MQNPRVNIAGIRRADLLALLQQLSAARLSRQLRRLRDIGVIKRVRGTYRYYRTRAGRAATAALCRLTQAIKPESKQRITKQTQCGCSRTARRRKEGKCLLYRMDL
jgi:DNA-binding HxlR family transcriptional regulator